MRVLILVAVVVIVLLAAGAALSLKIVRIVTMPIQSQGIITRDNVSVDSTLLRVAAANGAAGPS